VPGIGVDFEHVPERFDLSIEEDEIAAAQNVYLLEMRPKPEAGEDRSSEVLGIWVRGPEWSERAWTPVQFSYASELDNVTTVIRLQKLDLNAEIPADTFQFTPPSGTEIITITADYKSDQ
jgi:outer membrane lipoprotein-sorting protein